MKRFFITAAIALLLSCTLFAFYAVYYLKTVIHHVNVTAAMLPQEKRVAKQAGINIDPAHFQKPPPPPKLNAALDINKLTALLKKRPLTTKQHEALMALFEQNCPPEQVDLACNTVSQREDLMRLVTTAASKPDCVFVHDWPHAYKTKFPEINTIRTAVLMINAESLVLLRRGNWSQAIKTQTLGFKLAKDLESDQTMLALLMETSLNYNSLVTMQKIMEHYASNPEAIRLIDDIVTHCMGDVNIKGAYQGEIIMGISACDDVIHKNALSDVTNSQQKAMLSRLARKAILDAGLAIYLREMIPVYSAACLKPPERTQALDSAYNRIQKDMDHAAKSHDMAWLLPLIFMPIINPTWIGGSDYTERNVLLASASVLEYHSRHGSYPNSLSMIAPSTLHPIMGNPVIYHREKNGFSITGASQPMDIRGAQVAFKYP